MKKIFNYMFAVLAGVAALTACTNEPEEGVTPAPEGKTLTVVASMDDTTKAIFTDGEGLNWSVGDMLVAFFEKVDEETGDMVSAYANSNVLNDETITDGATGTFTFSGINAGDAWFAKGQNIGGVYNLEYLFKNEITQPAAGGIDPSLIKLISNTKTITDTDASVEVEMKLVGTMMRYLIYSSKGTYATEQVTSVKLIGNENFSGQNAVIAYNLTEGTYKQADGSYGENCAVFYGCDSDYINVKLNTPAALDATNAEGCIGKGVYMPVPPISLTGYKYEVTTTNHRFTFDASSKAVTFKENEVKNVLLDVDHANVIVEELEEEEIGTGVVTFEYSGGNGNPGDLTIESRAYEYEQIGANIIGNYYIVPYIDGEKLEGNWTSDEVQTAYKMLTFTCRNGAADGPIVDWVTVGYPKDSEGYINSAWPVVNATKNVGDTRKTLVVATLTTPEGYTYNGETVTDKFMFQFFITQEAASVEVVATLEEIYDGTAVSKNGADVTVGTLAITADGADALADYDTYCDVKISGGASVAVDTTTGVVTATIPANATSNTKEYTLTIVDAKGNDLVEAVTINQEAGDGSGDSAFSEYSWEVSLVGGRAWDSAWGFGSGDANKQTGHYLSVSNITHNGTAVNFTNTAEDLELAQAIAEYAFRTSAPTDEEKATYGQSAKTGSQFAIKAFHCYGQMIQVAWVLTDSQTISKTTGYDAAGNEVGSVIVWVD